MYSIAQRSTDRMFEEYLEIVKKEIDKNNAVKSEGIVTAILEAIDQKVIKRGSQLPSVNVSVDELSVARKTVVKAYKELIGRGIVESRPRHGYFVKSEDTSYQLKVMLLLHEFSPFQQILYDSFKQEVGDYATVDVFFHHCNIDVFGNIILDNLHKYGLFVVTPFEHPQVPKIIENLPSDKVLIIDQKTNLQPYSFICQDFNESVIKALTTINEKLHKYKKGYLLFPEDRFFPKAIKQAFIAYMDKIKMPLTIVPSFISLEKHCVYFVLSDFDLVKIVKETNKKGLTLGKEVGLISYNDTPLKEVIKEGITSISTDFKEIGSKAGLFVKDRIPIAEIIDTKIILRESI